MKTIFYLASVLVTLSTLVSCTAEEMPQNAQVTALTTPPIDPPIIVDKPK